MLLFCDFLDFKLKFDKKFIKMIDYFRIMGKSLIKWDIYEIKAKSSHLTGVMLRGRIRKLCLENNKNVLLENAEESENIVRFAVLSGEDAILIKDYLRKILPDVHVEKIKEEVINPILSKIKVNLEERYAL